MTNVIQSAVEIKGDGTFKGRQIGSNCSSSPGLGKKRLDARSYKFSLLKGRENRSQESAPKKKQKNQGEVSQENGKHVEASRSKQVDEVYGGAVRSKEAVGIINDAQGSDRENGELLRKEFKSPASRATLSCQPAPVLSTKEVANITEKLQVGCSTKGNIAEVSLGTTAERTSDSGGSLKRKRNLGELDSDDPLTEGNEVINSSADPVSSKTNSNMANILERCDACSQRQRSAGTAEKCNMCSCNYVKNRDTCNNSSLEAEDELSTKACIGRSEESYSKVQLEKSPMHTNTDIELNFCTICKLGGKLLSCKGKGCKTKYHIYCLDPPLKVVPPGVWHCVQCIKKKIQFGVHSVSEGIESVCDVREEEVPDCAGFQKQKQYLVKYKGLAHVHNRWVSEHELFLEAPSLVAKCRKLQTLKWKPELSKPQRMVLKRVLMSPAQSDRSFSGCQCEWFVKWYGLGYEHATWELENASFLKSLEVMPLIREYESRHERAIWLSNPTNEKLLEKKKHTSFKLSELPGSNASGLHKDHLDFVNKLREYWSRNDNVVVVENQERVLKVVSFIQSMKSDVCRPFLIISTSSSMSAWESEFMRVAPSVSVVAYNGNKDAREIIRALEFYEDGGCVMLQVLLAPIDAVIEDLEALEFIGWEAVIVDECQLSRISSHFEQINKLTHLFKILLLSGQLKETIAEYLNLLTFVEPGGDWKLDGNLKDDSRDTLSKLKERFARFIACEEKFEASKFVEYWVPVQLSNVEREQYCAALFANSVSLKSSSKTDILGALAEVLKSVQRCCDHPYLVDQSLRSKLRGDLTVSEYLDVDINAGGKIQVLDKILQEIKRRGLRAVILFQSADSKRSYIGEFLEDLICQRFGVDSYEHIDNGLSTSKKQAAVNLFNNRERGRFVFLIDYRACKQSIKLSSVDLVILFNGSWNPQDDLRSLRKISIDSQFEKINVFRLYSCCTVEEKVLSLAKQGVALDSNNIQSISCSTSHSLLLWGAHFQFHKLDEFHNSGTSLSDTNIQQSYVNDLVQEMLSQLRRGSESELKSCNIIAEAPRRGAAYIEDIPLAGEKEMQSKDEELPHVAWKNLFDGRHPQWRYASAPFQRIRRKVQNFDELPEIPRENEEPPNKRKKVVSNTKDSSTVKWCLGNKKKSMSMDKEGVSATLSYAQNDVASTENESFVEVNLSGNWHDSQKKLYLSLKPQIMKLCEILNLPDEVKSMAGRFLEYIMNNHRVNQEPVSIYHAFQISLCWSAVSLSNYKFSRKNSVSRVKQHLDYFKCSEEEVEKVYVKLQMLSEMFRQQTKGRKSHRAENLSVHDKAKLSLQSKSTQSNSSSQQHLEGGAISPPGSSHQRLASDSENASSSLKEVSSKRIEHVKKIHSGRMKKLYQKQQEEFEKFKKYRETTMEKQGKKEELDNRLKSEQRKLEDMQRKARNEEKQKRSHWLEVAESGRSVSPYANVPLSDSGFSLENMEEIGKDVLGDDSKQDPPVSVSAAEVVVVENCATENPPLVAVQLGEIDVNMNISPLEHASYMSTQVPPVSVSVSVSVSAAEVVMVENCATENSPLVAVQLGETDVNMNFSLLEHASYMSTQDQPVSVSSAEVAVVETCATENLPLVAVQLGEMDVNMNTSLSEHASHMSKQDPPVSVLSAEVVVESCATENPPLVAVQLGEMDVNMNTSLSEHASHMSKQDPPVSVSPAEAVVENCATENPPLVAVQLGEMDVNMNTALSEHASHMSKQDPAVSVSSAVAVQSGEMDVNMNTSLSEHASHMSKQDPPVSVSVSPAEAVVENCATENPPLVAVQLGEMDVNMNTSLSEYASHMGSMQRRTPYDSASKAPSLGKTLSGSVADQEHAKQTLLGPVSDQDHSPPAQDDHSPFNQVTHGITNQCSTSQPHINDEEVPSQGPLIENQHPSSTEQSEGPHTEQIKSQVPAQLSEGPAVEQIQSRVPAELSEGPRIEQIRSQGPAHQSEGRTIEQIQSQIPAQQSEGHFIKQNQSQVPIPIEQIQPQVPSTTRAPENHSASQHTRVRPDSLSIERIPSPSTQHTARSMPTQPLLLDPLQNELGRLHREQEQTAQMLENEKQRIRAECEKAMEVIRNKYKSKLEQAEMELAEKKKALDLSYNMVYKNRLLAEAFKLKVLSPGVQGTMQQQRPTITTTNPGPSRPPPPLQTVYQPSALFSTNPVRSPSTPLIQSRGRAPAPHLQQRYRPVSSPHILPSQQLASYHQYGLSSLDLLADMEVNPNPNPYPYPNPNPFSPRGN